MSIGAFGRRASARALLFAGCFGAGAYAASAQAATGSDDNANAIVVTATKRETTLQQVPVAVSVASAETIAAAHIRDMLDLSSVVPSLRVSEHANSSGTDFLIRGFGNGANNYGIEPSAGMFVDGVYRSRSTAQVGDLPDVSRVEVLRGPQSTLFGKNASAGVVSISTDAPKFRSGGSAEVSVGNYNALVARTSLTGPITDTLAASASAEINQRDGYLWDAGTHTATNTRNRWLLRGQLLYAPADGPRVRIIADTSRLNELCCGVVNLHSSAATAALQALGGQVNAPDSPYGAVYSNFPSTNDIRDGGVSAQVDYTWRGVKLTSITAWRRNHSLTNQDSDFTSADLLSRNSADVLDTAITQELRASASLGSRIDLLGGVYYFREKITQTGQLQWGSQMRSYADQLIQGGSGGLLNVASLESLLGATPGSFFKPGTGLSEAYHMGDDSTSLFGQADFKLTRRLKLTAGLNYTSDTKNFSTNTVSNDAFSAINLDAAAYAPLRQQLLYVGALGAGMSTAQAGAYAAANANNAAANPLASLRELQFMPPFLNVPNAVEPGHTHDGNLSYTLRAAYDVSARVNAYASVGTGFKASSINLSRDSRPALADEPAIVAGGLATTNLRYVAGGGRYAGPEKSTVFELGAKGHWGPASANVAVFYQVIRGFQSNIFTGMGFDLKNADKESVWGAEFEGQMRLSREITLSEAATWLRPRYDSFTNSSFGNLSGATPAGITPLSSTTAISWDHALPGGDHVVARADWHYEAPCQIEDGLPGFITTSGGVTDYQSGIDAAKAYRRTVSQFDASLTWKMAEGLDLSVWGRNITDDRYITVVFDGVAQPGAVQGYVNQPRTWGLSALYRF